MIVLIILGIVTFLAWYPVLNFWFFQSWEATWLIGNCGHTANPICLMQGHALLYYLDYRIFGWNPWGWYLTTLLLHVVAVFLIYKLVAKLTQQNLLAFIVALIFGVNITYYDVLTWGSFNGLYALMMDFFLAASIFYLRVLGKAKRKIFWYSLIVLALSVGLFVRESSLILPAFIFLVYWYKHDFCLTKKDMLFLLKTIIPLFVIIGIYFYIRKTYGGPSYDYIDETVKYRVKLLSQGLYIDYIRRAIMLIGVLIAPQAIPFQILNIVREYIANRFHPNFIRLYFFSFAGYAYTAVQVFLVIKNWKNKTVRNLLLLGLFWALIPAAAASLPISFTDEVFQRQYDFNTPSRWRYFAFFGTALFWTTAFWSLYSYALENIKVKKQYVTYGFAGLIILVLGFNFLMLRGIEDEIYKTSYKPEKEFYIALKKDFPTLPKDYIFYVFPASGPLKDYLSEWYHFRDIYYPNLTDVRGIYWEESHMAMLFERYLSGSAKLSSTVFVAYDGEHGLINKTAEARNMLTQAKEQTYPINQNSVSTQSSDFSQHQISIPLKPSLHVEIPYTVTIALTASGSHGNGSLLDAYVADRLDFLQNAKVTVCATAPIGDKPAYHLNANNLIDGNIGQRSFWVADCLAPWFIVDLGKEKNIGGIAFHTKQSPQMPSHYIVEVSSDGKNWTKAEEVNNNTLPQRIDVFDHPIEGRYVRFISPETLEGAMLALDEFEVFNSDSIGIVSQYNNNFERLLQDSYAKSGLYLRYSWETNPNNFTPEDTITNNSFYLPIIVDGTEHTYTINPNEGEYYSNDGQFLDRYITSIDLDFVGNPASIYVSNLDIKPRFDLSSVLQGDKK